jgi:hypothetical protein
LIDRERCTELGQSQTKDIAPTGSDALREWDASTETWMHDKYDYKFSGEKR